MRKSVDYIEFIIIQRFVYFIIFVNCSHAFFMWVKYMLNLCIHFPPVELIVKLLLEHQYPLTKLSFLLLLELDLFFQNQRLLCVRNWRRSYGPAEGLKYLACWR